MDFKMVTIKHYAFKDVTVEIPINWLINPYDNKNWVLNFLSLRWLKDKSESEIYSILNDFYHYHYVLKKKNVYLHSLRGDHAAAIRIELLINFLDIYRDNLDLVQIIKNIFKSEISLLLNEKMYRKGHNHGLMLDNAIIELYLVAPELFKNDK